MVGKGLPVITTVKFRDSPSVYFLFCLGVMVMEALSAKQKQVYVHICTNCLIHSGHKVMNEVECYHGANGQESYGYNGDNSFTNNQHTLLYTGRLIIHAHTMHTHIYTHAHAHARTYQTM